MPVADRVLLIEDDHEFRALTARYLSREGYEVTEADAGTSGLSAWRAGHPDVVVVDWLLPEVSGLDVVRTVRAAADGLPILMVTAKNEEPDIVVALELGADDYLVKPVSLRQLVARIRALLRRARGPIGSSAPGSTIQWGPFELDEVGHMVREDGAPMPLTLTEFKLLAVLIQHPGRVFTRLQLLQAATGDYFEEYERTVDSHVSHLRKKLHHPQYLHTVHSVGYKLDAVPS